MQPLGRSGAFEKCSFPQCDRVLAAGIIPKGPHFQCLICGRLMTIPHTTVANFLAKGAGEANGPVLSFVSFTRRQHLAYGSTDT